VPGKVAVIIPFFQNEPGILRRAVESVCVQDTESALEIIVVDDGSPVPARDELYDLRLPAQISLRVLKQMNAGPAAARNTALERLGNDTTYIAFLDSDDEWHFDHVQRATLALDCGYDFYFTDFQPIGWSESAFTRSLGFRPENHREIPCAPQMYEFIGFFASHVVESPVWGTSTIVIRRSPFKDIRFNEHLHYYEDHLYWFMAALRSNSVAFSTRRETRYGRGINMYYSTSWGTERKLLISLNEMMYRKTLQNHIRETSTLIHCNKAKITTIRREFLSNLIHLLRRGNLRGIPLLFRFTRIDPVALIQFLPCVGTILLKKIRNRHDDTRI